MTAVSPVAVLLLGLRAGMPGPWSSAAPVSTIAYLHVCCIDDQLEGIVHEMTPCVSSRGFQVSVALSRQLVRDDARDILR